MHTPVPSVLVAVFRDEQTIIPVLRKVLALGPLLKEVVIVDDESRDRMPELVQELAACEPAVRLCRLVGAL